MKIEILAPVGSIESLYTAIAHGANAVYLGLPKFQARAKAQDFTYENLQSHVAFAHAFNVKVYLTLNTLVTNEEWPELLQTIDIAMQAGIDAFILQDLGVAYTIKTRYPQAVLHASTQMGINNVYGAKIAEKLGFQRVVLARETTLEDIRAIKEQTQLEIEYFVQGALCVAYSGNCYLSSLTNGCSGNRGMCKQLCRLPLTAINDTLTQNGYFLSTTDLSLQKHLKEVIDAGVCSLKIEGRLRRPAYVAEAVRTYRAMVDHNFTMQPNNLQKCFYRGTYNDGAYLFPNTQRQNIINPLFANHRGISIGKVLKVVPFKNIYKIYIQSHIPILTGDGLKCVYGKNECSFGVGNVQKEQENYVVFSNTQPKPNAEVFKILDAEFEKALLAKKPTLSVNLHLTIRPQQPLQATLQCNQHTVARISSFVAQTAQTAPLTKDQVITIFSKTDTFPFNVNVVVDMEPFFAPKALLNAFRRDLFASLWKELTTITPPSALTTPLQTYTPPTCMQTFFLTNQQKAPKQTNETYMYAPSTYSLENVLSFAKEHETFILWLPVICNGKDMALLQHIIKELSPQNVQLVVNNIGQLTFANTFTCIAGPFLNISNNYTAFVLQQNNVHQFVRSFEPIFASVKGGLTYTGNVPVMQFAHCPWQALYRTDCKHCSYSSKPLVYKLSHHITLQIRRIQLSKCYAEAVWLEAPKNSSKNDNIIDIRT